MVKLNIIQKGCIGNMIKFRNLFLKSFAWALTYLFIGYFLFAKIGVANDGVIMGSTLLIVIIIIFCTYIILDKIENIK